jgi:small-conductance mechanosensitive channel
VVDALADSSVNLVLRAWVDTPDFAQARSDLLEAVHRGLPAAGYSIPYPQTDMHLHLSDALATLLQRPLDRPGAAPGDSGKG